MISMFITDIGDSAVLSGISLAGAAYFFFSGCRREGCALIAAFAATALLIGVLKLVLLGCSGVLADRYHAHSPSGHAALSTAVLGTYSYIFSQRTQGIKHYLILVAGTLLIAAIALTRVLLEAHTVAEVVIGLLAGGAILLPVCLFLRHSENLLRFDVRILMAIMAVVIIVLHGQHFPAEDIIQAIAHYLKHNVTACS